MSQELADAQAAIDARVAKELRIGHDEIVALIMEWNNAPGSGGGTLR